MSIENSLIPRILALHLLKVALQDSVRPLATKWDQVNAAKRDALDFLFSKERAEDVKMWCDIANLNYQTFMARAREVRENQIDISKVEVELSAEMSTSAVEDDADGED